MRTTVRARRDLVAHRVSAANQLRAHLQLVFPAAASLFADIDTAISLSFIERFTTQTQADWLSAKRLGTWLRSVGYSGRTDPEILQARLLAAPRGTVGSPAEVHAATTLAYVAFLRVLNTQIALLEANLAEQLTTHPDTHIYASLPRVKTLRTARLLAEIGDARGKFPTPQSLAALAGVAPSTRQSGKVKAVTFRWGCNKQLRDALCDFAGDSRHDNPWAADLYNRAITRGHDHQHAVRILGRAWAHVIWRCWHDNLSYDPSQHRALQTVLAQTTAEAA
jgi:transposase